MGFVWVHADSFLRCVAFPFHSFVTTYVNLKTTENELAIAAVDLFQRGDAGKNESIKSVQKLHPICKANVARWRAEAKRRGQQGEATNAKAKSTGRPKVVNDALREGIKEEVQVLAFCLMADYQCLLA